MTHFYYNNYLLSELKVDNPDPIESVKDSIELNIPLTVCLTKLPNPLAIPSPP